MSIDKTAKIIGEAIVETCQKLDIDPVTMNLALIRTQAMMQLALVLCVPEIERAHVAEALNEAKALAEEIALEHIRQNASTCH